MQLRYAQAHSDGTVTIWGVASKEELQVVLRPGGDPLTDEEVFQHFLERNSLKGDEVTKLPDDYEPPDKDRSYRNAWTFVDGKVLVDMPRAREIHKDKLRSLRAPKFSQLDMEYLRADEVKNEVEKARIAAEKQALRYVTDDPRIEAALNPDELRAVLPDILKVVKSSVEKV